MESRGNRNDSRATERKENELANAGALRSSY